MNAPGSPSEVFDTVESERPVTSVRLQGRHEDDGYELVEPLVLSELSTDEAMFAMIAADPENGMVTLHRSGTEEYWQFPLDRVASMSHTEFEFLLPERLKERSSVKKIAALCAIISAALLAVLAGVHASTDVTPQPPAAIKIPGGDAEPHRQAP